MIELYTNRADIIIFLKYLTLANYYGSISTITFRNNLSKKKVIVTFTMNTGQNNFINSKDLSKTEKKLDNLESLIKKFNMEFKLNRDIHIRRYESKL